jgi:NAD(P)-dependent dehydrogenase (short-subunit alcohol dehydrogenase family)
MATYLITGANRGLGLEFARQLSTRKDDIRILATARDPEKAADLARLVHDVIPLDVADPASIDRLPDHVNDRPIDVLINNAGVSSNSKSLETLDPADLHTCFAINSIGPMLVTRTLLKNLRAGQRKTVFNITSQLGSIANNKGGSSYGYRASKAALNMMTVSLASELRKDGFTCVVAHPGWVQTDMGGPNAPLKPDESIAALLKLIDGLKPEDTGKFFNYDGKTLPW